MPEYYGPEGEPYLVNYASILDPATLSQAIETAKLPFVQPHLALMPDAHLGKGATVGSVIPTVGAIIPAAVGVDIGCLDADTEYLSPTGWVPISKYESGPVMQFNAWTGRGSWTEPEAYIIKDAEFFYHLKSKYGIDQMLTPDHKMLVHEIVGRDRRRVMKAMLAEEYVTTDRELEQGYKAELPTAFTLEAHDLGGSPGVEYTNPEIRVIIMTSADATLNGKKAVLHLKKQRKIRRAIRLLGATEIEYTVSGNADGSVNIRYTPPVLTKDLSILWPANAWQLQVINEELLYWDGSLKDQVFYTRDKANADFASYVFAASGFRSVMREDVHKRDGKTDYRVFRHRNTNVGRCGNDRTPIEEVPSADGKAYCFTVPTGFLVARRNGKVFITGNCGMNAVLTQWTKTDLEGKDLQALHARISQEIPLSAGNYDSARQGRSPNKARLVAMLEGVPGVDQAEAVTDGGWRRQLGSLGSGNHFIEVSLDEEDRVWLFLHSGSRGVGNRLAQKHIEVAKSVCDTKSDLAHLTEGTPEFDSYIEALFWAQQFAFYNRDEMMYRLKNCMEEMMQSPVESRLTVQCHHNYTERMPHLQDYGPYYLSRKGAIAAYEGTWGLIPGSMGTRSYVVQGRGNAEALWSAPHGAGRNYSRSKAKREFTRESLDDWMDLAGTVWGNSDAFIDEHPLAYKDIDVIMRDADSLVEIKHELRAIVNVKGN